MQAANDDEFASFRKARGSGKSWPPSGRTACKKMNAEDGLLRTQDNLAYLQGHLLRRGNCSFCQTVVTMRTVLRIPWLIAQTRTAQAAKASESSCFRLLAESCRRGRRTCRSIPAQFGAMPGPLISAVIPQSH